MACVLSEELQTRSPALRDRGDGCWQYLDSNPQPLARPSAKNLKHSATPSPWLVVAAVVVLGLFAIIADFLNLYFRLIFSNILLIRFHPFLLIANNVLISFIK